MRMGKTKKVDRKQLAICRQRGHKALMTEKWSRCEWCRVWVREVRKIEERESDPPDGERDPLVRAEERLAHRQAMGALEEKAAAKEKKLRAGNFRKLDKLLDQTE